MLIGMAEAAKLLNYSTSGLRKLVSRRAIRYFQARPHAAIKFRREWLEEFVEGGATVPAGKTAKRAPVNVPSQFGFDPALLKL